MLHIEYQADGPTLRNFINCRADRSYIRGPIGGGKTTACVMKMLAISNTYPPCKDRVRRTRWGVVRNTTPQLEQTTIQTFSSWVPADDAKLGRLVKSPKMRQKIFYNLPDGTSVEIDFVFYAIDKEAQKRDLLGAEFTGIYFNELREFPEHIIDDAEGRTGRWPHHDFLDLKPGAPDPWRGIIADTNAMPPLHWLYKKETNQWPPGTVFHVQPGGAVKDPVTDTWVANPNAENLKYLREDYYARAIANASEDYLAVMVGNQFGEYTATSPVHRNYTHDWHAPIATPPEYEQNLPLIVGIDPGFNFAASFCQFDPETDQLRVIDEYLNTERLTTRDNGSRIRAKMGSIQSQHGITKAMAIIDPAGNHRQPNDGISAFQLLHDMGIPIQLAPTNRLNKRIDALDNRLLKAKAGLPGLLLHRKNCPITCAAVQSGYHYPLKHDPHTGNMMQAGVPPKNEASHIVEALQYVCCSIEGNTLNYLGFGAPQAQRRPHHSPQGWMAQ